MKHIVARAFSTVRTNFKFGAPGLGDRIHHILFAYNYSVMENTPVTLHLTKYQWNRNKPESWPEILSLFPDNRVKVIPHLDYEPKHNKDFLNFVKGLGYSNAEEHIYKDHPQKYEPKEGIDLTKYLKMFPQVKAEDCTKDLKLPKNFITVQFDSTSKSRMMKQKNRQDILEKYKNYEKIIVDGESKNELLKNSLKHIAYAMSKAKHHVGVDSGFFHMSQVYFSPKNIHIYTTRHPKKWSHHMQRARDNGIFINGRDKKL